MDYKVKIARSAVKEIKRLPQKTATRIHAQISALAADPRPAGVVKLTSFKDLWRVRVGNYRILYAIEDKIRVIEVRNVVDRKDAY